MTVLLARHGSHSELGTVLSGRSEIGLSDRGVGEATWLGERLAAARLRAVHSSPRRRAVETARIIAARHALEVEMAEALDEIDFGDWSGRDFAALADDPAWMFWNERRGSAATPGGETIASATARAVRHIEASASRAQPILFVSHCDIIRGVVAHYLGLDPDRLLGFDVDPASLTTLALHPGGGRVMTLNERPA